jgi:hypothetical protein
MTTSGEQTPAEVREAELARVFRRMGRAARRGDAERFEELKAEHEALKAEHVRLSHEEQREAARERLRVQVAERPSPGPGRWRPPAGFGVSPGAVQRAREGVAGGGLVPDSRRRVLAPWRRGHPASEVVWRPGV